MAAEKLPRGRGRKRSSSQVASRQCSARRDTGDNSAKYSRVESHTDEHQTPIDGADDARVRPGIAIQKQTSDRTTRSPFSVLAQLLPLQVFGGASHPLRKRTLAALFCQGQRWLQGLQ